MDLDCPARPRVFHPPRVFAAIAVLTAAAALLAAPPLHAQISRNVTLLSNLHLYPDDYSACWDYIHNDGREYVISNTERGASIVRLTDPAHPVEVKFIELPNSFWHEAKQYREWVYVTTEVFNGFSAERGFEIINMQDPDHPRLVNFSQSGVTHVHTVSVDPARGLLFLNGCDPFFGSNESMVGFTGFEQRHPAFVVPGSMRIYSLADPENPVQIGFYNRYVHDLHIRGTLGFASMIYENELVILDLSDPTHPTERAIIHTANRSVHSSWTTEDGRFLYVFIEESGVGPLVYDISDLSNIRQVFQFQDLPGHIAHNPRVLGSRLFVSYYTAGVRVWDIRNPAWPVESGYYDTYPGFDDDFYGCWEVDPYFPSGIVAANDINTGLWIFRPDPINYGIVRGTVRDGQSGPVVAGATVIVAPGGFTVNSGPDGRFAFAVPPGSVTLTATKYGYNSGSKSVSVTLNSDQTIQINVRAKATGTVRGVVSAAGGGPLAAADVELVGTPFKPVVTASNGSYEFLSVPEGAITVRSVRPGFQPKQVAATVQGGKVATANLALAGVVVYDDLESDAGWDLSVPSDDADAGLWIHAVPARSAFAYAFDPSFVAQPGEDHSPDAGTQCFVTGNSPFPTAIFNQSVMNGTTTLTSRDYSLSGITNPRIGYWRWFGNKIPELRAENPLVVQISGDGGSHWTTVETTYSGVFAWRYVEIPVGSFLPGATQARLRFIASETDAGFCLVECLVDDIQIYSGGSGSPAASVAGASSIGAPAVSFGVVRPTPTRGGTAMELTLARPAVVSARVYDSSGRLVRSVFEGPMAAGTSTVHWDGRLRNGEMAASGVYWLKASAGDVERRFKVVLVR